MKKTIKTGVGVMIRKGDKILLGHRCEKSDDTGGIFEPGTWTFPGGKQEFGESIFECAKREVKEETNLDISDFEIFGADDDIQGDRHFVTLWVTANEYSGILKIEEPQKIDKWEWFSVKEIPINIYTPTKKFIQAYINKNSEKERLL